MKSRPLTNRQIARLGPGMHAVGYGCLYVCVKPSGARSFIYRYRGLDGRQRDMGLGSCTLHTVDQAVAAALEYRQARARGVDPIEQRARQRGERRLAQVRSVAFAQCFAAYCQQKGKGNESKGGGWSPGYAKRMTDAITRYAVPVLDNGRLPVDRIDSQLILQVVEPIWHEKNATAAKLRWWLESILNFAAAKGWRPRGDNPAAWTGNLEAALGKPSQVAPTEHQAALPWTEVPAYFAALKAKASPSTRPLELIALTLCRKHQAVEARWGQFDLAARKWTIPAGRNRRDDAGRLVREGMKKNREHIVALPQAAVDLLTRWRAELGAVPHPQAYVFPSAKNPGRPLSLAQPQTVLFRLGWRERCTVHGIRSSFIDFARVNLMFERDARELALAHRVGDETYQAYARNDLFQHRLALADAWANHCLGQPIDRAWVAPGALTANR
jgi:integrase